MDNVEPATVEDREKIAHWMEERRRKNLEAWREGVKRQSETSSEVNEGARAKEEKPISDAQREVSADERQRRYRAWYERQLAESEAEFQEVEAHLRRMLLAAFGAQLAKRVEQNHEAWKFELCRLAAFSSMDSPGAREFADEWKARLLPEEPNV